MPQYDHHTATIIAMALRSASSGGDPKEDLVAMAQNLGIEPIGKESEWVDYEPLELHYDEFGFGLLPGDQCIIRFPGWRYADGTVIMKAVVSLSAKQRRDRAEARSQPL